MPSGQISTDANRAPVYVNDDTVLGKLYLDALDLSGVPGNGGVPGSITGAVRTIVTAAATLTASQSGALCVWPTAAGFTYTLPVITASNVGMWFEFLCSITNTSVVCKVITGQATDLMIGGVITYVDATTPAANPGPKGFSFNGTNHVACNFGGTDTTSGGLAGTRVVLQATAALKWVIQGSVFAAGTIVTPAATS